MKALRRTKSSLLGGVAIGIVVLLAMALWRVPERRLNVLLITLDTARADHLGCYGYAAAKTSALDALASRGVLFERAYAPAPLTLPSHTTMLTGLYPPEHGVRANGEGSLPEFIPTLASRLREEGYRTNAAFVAAFVLDSKFGLARGFDVYDDGDRRCWRSWRGAGGTRGAVS